MTVTDREKLHTQGRSPTSPPVLDEWRRARAGRLPKWPIWAGPWRPGAGARSRRCQRDCWRGRAAGGVSAAAAPSASNPPARSTPSCCRFRECRARPCHRPSSGSKGCSGGRFRPAWLNRSRARLAAAWTRGTGSSRSLATASTSPSTSRFATTFSAISRGRQCSSSSASITVIDADSSQACNIARRAQVRTK